MGRDFKDIQLAGKALEMNKHVDVDSDRINRMTEIKLKVFNEELTPEEARKLVNTTFESFGLTEVISLSILYMMRFVMRRAILEGFLK